MPTYVDEKRRRIEQFAEYLRLMGLRRHKIVKDTCFIVFDDTPPEDSASPKIKESVAIRVDCLVGGGSALGPEESGESPSSDGHGGEPQPRFVQFAFMQACFSWSCPTTRLSAGGRADSPAQHGILLGKGPAGSSVGPTLLERHDEMESVAKGLPVP